MIMNNKYLGASLIILGLLLFAFVLLAKQKEDFYINSMIEVQGGSCFLEDGTCLHADRDYTAYIVGFGVSIALMVFGIYLFLFDKSQDLILKQNKEVSSALLEAKRLEKSKSDFDAFLSAFSSDEQKVLKAVKDQEGITQSTLRFRTGLSKASLSLLLKDMESKNIISRTQKGKTNQVFLIKKF